MENPYSRDTATLGPAFYAVFISQILALVTPVYENVDLPGEPKYIYLVNMIDFLEFLLYIFLIGCTYYYYINRYRLVNQAILPLIIILLHLFFIGRMRDYIFIVELIFETEVDLKFAPFFLIASLVIFTVSLSPFEIKKRSAKT